ncbi:MAG TPA: Hsp20/alpha crystallin family protein [Planctomycetota bacterium]
MNVIPWRKRDGDLTVRSDFDDLFQRLFEPFEWRTKSRLPLAFAGETVPAMNVAETEGHYVVTLELPGLDAKDVSIELMGNQLQVTGERRWEEEKKGKEFHRVESQYGRFARSLTLPENLRLGKDAIEATFQKGVLEIRIPKLEPTPAEKIPIQAR